jgi:hypothetical protein
VVQKIITAVLIKKKFNEDGAMHTYLGKASVPIIFFAMMYFMIARGMIARGFEWGPIWVPVLWIVMSVMFIALCEEIVIIVRGKEYEPNHRGYLFQKCGKKDK